MVDPDKITPDNWREHADRVHDICMQMMETERPSKKGRPPKCQTL